MLHTRLTTWQKAATLVPLALLSGAGTAEFTAVSAASGGAATGEAAFDAQPAVATQAIVAAPQLAPRSAVALGVPAGSADRLVDDVPTEAIPPAALQAYQRASQVLTSADRGCKLSWQLLAAVGRVESDHGRYGGNKLDEDGRSTPGILGVPLDGSGKTARILDTDAGELDDDRVYDRAVGPMQFIPSTWSVVGVDGDGDGVRDPQDIDDAALASAVYLCSGDEDLSTVAGQRTSVYRYNHSEDYVDLVLAIMKAYLEGEYSSVPATVDVAPVELPPGPAQGGTPHATAEADATEGVERQQGDGESRAKPAREGQESARPQDEPHDSNSRVEPAEAETVETEAEAEAKPDPEPDTEEAASEDEAPEDEAPEDEAPSESEADDPAESAPDEVAEVADDADDVPDTAADDASDETGDDGTDADEVPAAPEGDDAGDQAAADGSETAEVPTESEGDADGGDSASAPDDGAAEPDVDTGDQGESGAEEGSPGDEQEPVIEADEAATGSERVEEQGPAEEQDEAATPTNLNEAADVCQRLLTAAEIESLGGLDACAETVLAAAVGDAEEPLPDWLGQVLHDAGVLRQS
jgi:membrane-bound lytic murein transglycosylase B